MVGKPVLRASGRKQPLLLCGDLIISLSQLDENMVQSLGCLRREFQPVPSGKWVITRQLMHIGSDIRGQRSKIPALGSSIEVAAHNVSDLAVVGVGDPANQLGDLALARFARVAILQM